MSKIGDRFLTGGTVACVGLTLFLLFRPTGLVGAWVSDWQQRRTTARAIHAEWDSLTALGNRLSVGTAQVKLVEFADYQCPFCRLRDSAVEAFAKTNPAIGVVYVDFPLDIHPAARGAALAALCASSQGRFREMHHQLFVSSRWESDTNWVREAKAANVPDIRAFQSCLTSSETASRLDREMDLGDSLHIGGTPSFATASGIRVGVLNPADVVP